MIRQVAGGMAGIVIALSVSTDSPRAAWLTRAGTTSNAEAANAEGSIATAPPRPARLEARLAHLLEEAHRTDDGRLAIANRAYQATFSAEHGVVYLPRTADGLDARRRWQYRARAIETAAGATSLEAVAPVVSPAGDHIVDFVRPGLVERYVGKPDGVEQVFVLETRPGGAGDVRIRGDVTFPGTGRVTETGLEFRAEGREPFTYAAPIAFDADRRPLAVRAELAGDRLDLVLDARSLRDARFPVTIDPLFGVADAYHVGAYARAAPDVAYNWTRDEFLVAFNAPVPALPDESGPYPEVVRVKRFSTAGDSLGGSQAVSPSADDVFSPAVAYDMHIDRYLVVWTAAEAGSNGALTGRLLGSDGAPLGGTIAFGPSETLGRPGLAARNLHPHSTGSVSFAVVWMSMLDGSQSVLRRALVTGSGVSQGSVAFATTGFTGLEGPSVAYDPIADRFLAVSQCQLDCDTLAWTITPGSAQSGPFLVAASTGPGFSGGAAVAFDAASRRYLVVFGRAGGYAARLVGSGPVPQPIGDVFALPGQAAHNTMGRHRVAADAGSFLVAYPAKASGGEMVRHVRVSAAGHTIADAVVDTVSGQFEEITAASVAIGQHGHVFGSHTRKDETPFQEQGVVKVSRSGRWFAHAVHGQSGDFTGDGKSDLFIFRPASASVHVWSPTQTATLRLGSAGAIPVLLDWDGDGLVDVGTFRPSTGVWTIRLTGTGAVEQVTNMPGGPGDIPVPGDYLGDGADEVAIFRPWTGEWIMRPRKIPGLALTPIPFTIVHGQLGDVPVPADWDGDGRRELGVFRQSSGEGVWLFRDLDGNRLPAVQWGSLGDIPLQGNFVGSAHADQVVYRPAEGKWYRRDGATGAGTIKPHPASGIPMPLDYDGDGLLDLVLFNEATGTWSVMDPSGNSNVSLPIGWGGPGDLPAGTR